MNRISQNAIKRDKHEGYFSHFIYHFSLAVVEDFKHKCSQRLKAAVEYD
jgi:hypothetical protein